MVKEGPCCHCGVTSTPLWRNGPEDKPVLCNACGSRWRTKGTLENYIPLRARELIDQAEPKIAKEKLTPLKNNVDRVQKRKPDNVRQETEKMVPQRSQNLQKVSEEDTSTQSSSESAASCSESSIPLRAPDGNDLVASAQCRGWDVPSKKRTCLARRRPSPVEKLRKDLFSIYHEQGSSSISTASDGDLLYGTETQTGSIEIGHGSVLIRPPDPKLVEEESQASSFPVDNRSYIANETTSRSVSYSVYTRCLGMGKSEEHTPKLAQEHVKRDETLCEMLDFKQDRNSPLSSIDLNDVINFETFTSLSSEEQQQLMKLLSPVDSLSLKSMFCSPQFQENVQSFLHLLRMEIIDLSFSVVDPEECKSLKKLVLSDLIKATWLEQYQQQKDLEHKQNTPGSQSSILRHSSSIPFQRQNYPVLKGRMRSPRSKCRPSGLSISSKTPTNFSDVASRLAHTSDTLKGNEEACFSPSRIFASTPDANSMLSSFQLTDKDSHPSVLVNTSSSTPELEILGNPYNRKTVQATSFEGQGSNSPQPKHRLPNKMTTNAPLFECSNVCL